MSCDAEKNATITAISASAMIAFFGDAPPIAAMPAISSSWVITIQPRRRPSNGGTKRSMKGAHRNLSV